MSKIVPLDENLPLKKIETIHSNIQKVILNLRGSKFEVALASLGDKLPKSRLGRLKICLETNKIDYLNGICDDFDLERNEFYFNVDPSVFHMILNYFNGEKIHYDRNVCANYFHKQIEFWGLDEFDCFDECCQYNFFENFESIRSDLNKRENIIQKHEFKHDFSFGLFPKILEKLWLTIEYPKSSKYAIVREKFCFLFCHKKFSKFLKLRFMQYSLIQFNSYLSLTSFVYPTIRFCPIKLNWAFPFEYICVIWFSIEVLIFVQKNCNL